MKRRLKIHVMAAITIMFVFGMFITMESKAASAHYDVFLELVDQSTGATVSNPNVKYTFYAEDGSIIKLGADSEYRNSAYFSNDQYMYYYYTGYDKPVKVKVELDGWIFEKDTYDIVYEDSGTSGIIECRLNIPVWPDTSLDTLTIRAGFQRGTSATDRTGKTFKIRKTGETEFSQTAVTNDDGMVTFAGLPLGAYDVYYVEKDKYYYIHPTSTGERYAYFATSTEYYYLELRSSWSYFNRNFGFEVTMGDGTVVEPSNSNGTRWTLKGGGPFYISTSEVPEGYIGKVFKNEQIIPYTNYQPYMYFEPDYDYVLDRMENKNFYISKDSSTGNFTARRIEDTDSLIDSFTDFTYDKYLQGTTKMVSSVAVDASGTAITNVSTNTETSTNVDFPNLFRIIVEKINNTTYTFNLAANINDKEVIVPVTIVVSESTGGGYSGVIDEDTLKVTKTSNSVSMSWEAPNDYVSYYKVQRYNSEGTLLKEYKVNKTSFKHTGLTANKTYNYRIYCCYYNANKDEEFCCEPIYKEVNIFTLKAVTNAKASNNKQNSIKLSWSKAANAAGYQIKRLNNAGTVLKTATTTKLTYTDTSLKAATKYTYKIRPYYVENGVKKFGPTVTIKTATVCKVPAAPTLKPSTKSMKISFKRVTGANGYEIAYSTSKSFTAKTTKKVTVTGTAATLSKTIKKLVKGKTYYVKVRAYVKTAAGKKVYTGYSKVNNVKVK